MKKKLVACAIFRKKYDLHSNHAVHTPAIPPYLWRSAPAGTAIRTPDLRSAAGGGGLDQTLADTPSPVDDAVELPGLLLVGVLRVRYPRPPRWDGLPGSLSCLAMTYV